ESNWAWNVAWWSDPMILGKYPEDALKKYEPFLPEISDADLKLINQPLDFYGQNIYNGYAVRMGENGESEDVERYDGFPSTGLGWPVTPEALYWGPKFLYDRYRLPFYITENGAAVNDVISLDGKVHDPQRIDFTERYLRALEKAQKDGVDVRGYFHWTLLDNFEWASGYSSSSRFGLVYVDYRTQERIIKDSGYWYSKLICQEI
ncbi:MAG: family 1 glycosylhydrolase, partial [Lachnospiraceae bacterium]|nr:family 1 glycosylhydrolase [Lachnospiraceae bacterium]